MTVRTRSERIVKRELARVAETAGIGARWPNMSIAERKAWLKRHPGSKYHEKLGDPVKGAKAGKAPAKSSAKKPAAAPRKLTRIDTQGGVKRLEPVRGHKLNAPKSSAKKSFDVHVKDGGKTIKTVVSAPDKKTASRIAREQFPDNKFSVRTPKKAKAPKGNVPTGTSAVQTSNHIMKAFKAKRLMKTQSNPYSDSQTFPHTMSHDNAKKLREHLKANGWKADATSPGTYEHDDGGMIQVFSDRRNSNAIVRVWGKKKAKRSNLPYYD